MKRVLLVLGACVTGLVAGAPAMAARTVAPVKVSSSVASDYGVYYAIAEGDGYVVGGVNGAALPCENGQLSAECYVSSINLSNLDLSSDSTEAILGQIGTSSDVTVLFSGQASGGTLNVWQVWRSPAPVSISWTLHAVSHADEQSLVVNQWSSDPLGALNFTSAPLADTCDVVPGTPCTGSVTAIEQEIVTTVGVLVGGSFQRGNTFDVTRYFLPVGVGLYESGDGYSYCRSEQIVCGGTFQCRLPAVGCIGTKGRGKGLAIIDPAGIVSDPTFQEWQLATGQLLSSDVSADDAGTP